MSTISTEQIRSVVRDALREALPEGTNSLTKRNVPNCQLMKHILSSISEDDKSPVVVKVDNDRQLNLFVKELAQCLQDQNVQALISAGRLNFKLQTNQNGSRHHNTGNTARRSSLKNAPVNRQTEIDLDKGVLTESKILTLAKTKQRIEIDRKVVVTPLAMERARKVGLEILRR